MTPTQTNSETGAMASADMTAQNNNKYCVPSCKHDGKEKKGNKNLPMTGCNFCMKWFHDECIVEIKTSQDTIWHCEEC